MYQHSMAFPPAASLSHMKRGSLGGLGAGRGWAGFGPAELLLWCLDLQRNIALRVPRKTCGNWGFEPGSTEGSQSKMLVENGAKMSGQLWECNPFPPIKKKRAEGAEMSHNLAKHGEAYPLGQHCAK